MMIKNLSKAIIFAISMIVLFAAAVLLGIFELIFYQKISSHHDFMIIGKEIYKRTFGDDDVI